MYLVSHFVSAFVHELFLLAGLRRQSSFDYFGMLAVLVSCTRRCRQVLASGEHGCAGTYLCFVLVLKVVGFGS